MTKEHLTHKHWSHIVPGIHSYSPISFDLTLIFHISKGLSFPPPSPPFDRVNAIISYFPFFLTILLYLYNIHKI